jgi:hypothetical protein
LGTTPDVTRIAAIITHSAPVERIRSHINELLIRHDHACAWIARFGWTEGFEPLTGWDAMEQAEAEYKFDQSING